MKIAHFSDLHFCSKHLPYVSKAFEQAIRGAIEHECDVAVISGDSFESTMGIHEPAYREFVELLNNLAHYMPVLVLQGTYSHDRLGSLDVIAEIGRTTPHGIRVSAQPEIIGLYWMDDDGKYVWGTDESKIYDLVCVFTTLPSLNKASPKIMEIGPQQWVRETLTDFGVRNSEYRNAEIPTVLVTHGTVTGCITESGFAMVSPDHEFTLATLASAETDAVMLGHIHQPQGWTEQTPSGAKVQIAYAGSIAKLVHGHTGPTGWLLWDVEAGNATWELMPVDSVERIDITFSGPPDLDELAEIAAEIKEGDHVRVEWQIDEDHAHTVDKKAILKILAAATDVQLKPRINPIQSVRSSGIGQARSLNDKIARWAETTGDEDRVPELQDKLRMLQEMSVDEIADNYNDSICKKQA